MFAACHKLLYEYKNEHPDIGQLIVCPDCHKNLVIVWLFPLELDFEQSKPVNDQIEYFFEN